MESALKPCFLAQKSKWRSQNIHIHYELLGKIKSCAVREGRANQFGNPMVALQYSSAVCVSAARIFHIALGKKLCSSSCRRWRRGQALALENSTKRKRSWERYLSRGQASGRRKGRRRRRRALEAEAVLLGMLRGVFFFSGWADRALKSLTT